MEPSWTAYTGSSAALLALVLALVAVAFTVAALRLRTPVPGPSASRGALVPLVLTWLLAIAMFLVDVVVYGLQARQVGLRLPAPPNHVTPVTLTAAGLSFVAVAVLTPARLRTRLGNALLCACVGPMVFELPFDLVVMARTTAIPPAPWLYVALFFLPLIAIELLTIVLTVTRPSARLTRWTCIWLAAMFAVFAFWALLGFAYPFGGLPLGANILAKLLAFLTALSLFVRRAWIRRAQRAG